MEREWPSETFSLVEWGVFVQVRSSRQIYVYKCGEAPLCPHSFIGSHGVMGAVAEIPTGAQFPALVAAYYLPFLHVTY